MEQTLFSCTNVHQEYSQFALQDISFALEPGAILGVIGKNGCGKTTLLKNLMGMLPAKADVQIELDGASLLTMPKEYKKYIAYVLQDSPFLENFNAISNGKMFGVYYDGFSMEKYMSLLEQYGILEQPGKHIMVKQSKKNVMTLQNLSQGEKIKQQLAFALSYEPKLYFMDEPTGNLDVGFRDEFYDTIRSLVADGQRSVIYTSHLIEEMEHFADYILWLREENGTSTNYFFGTVDDLRDSYRIVEVEKDLLQHIPLRQIVYCKENENHCEALIKMEDAEFPDFIQERMRYADLKEIMYYVEKSKI